jgi:site-specific recombinase XerC
VDLVDQQQVAWSYYKQVLAALRFFYRHVVRRGEVVDDVRGPRGEKRLPVVLSPAEVARFFHAIPSLKHRTVLMIAYGAGLRISEAIAVRLSDIDRERQTLLRLSSVIWNISRIGGSNYRHTFVKRSSHWLTVLSVRDRRQRKVTPNRRISTRGHGLVRHPPVVQSFRPDEADQVS